MIFSEEFILLVNRAIIGEILHDTSDASISVHHRPFVNSMIKLGYIERVEWDKVKKVKNIPSDMTTKKARELTKGIKLPKRQDASTWGKVVNKINNNPNDIMYIDPQTLSGKRTYCGYESINTYLNWLNNLGFIENIKKGRHYGFKIKRLKQIPDRLTVGLIQKMMYDNIYKRNVKIDKIKESMNNI